MKVSKPSIGILSFLLMIFLNLFPNISIPMDIGQVSNKFIFFNSSYDFVNLAAKIPAPIATALF